jgi:hypothetical protein
MRAGTLVGILGKVYTLANGESASTHTVVVGEKGRRLSAHAGGGGGGSQRRTYTTGVGEFRAICAMPGTPLLKSCPT